MTFKKYELLGSHMPFVANLFGIDTMLFCAKGIRGVWKSYYTPVDIWNPKQINLSFPWNTVECSPEFFTGGSNIILSVIADFQLKRFFGPSLDALSLDTTLPKKYDRAGYVSPNHIVRSNQVTTEIYTLEHELIKTVDIFSDFSERVIITRITYIPEDPDKMIVTGVTGPDAVDPISIIYSIETGKRWMFIVDGAPLYKCTLYKDSIIYAEKAGVALESRRLVKTKAFRIIPMEPLND